MNALPVITTYDAPATLSGDAIEHAGIHDASPEAWAAAKAARELTRQTEKLAYRARYDAWEAEREATGRLLPDTHPLCVAESAAGWADFDATQALAFTPIPTGDYAAFAEKLVLVREYVDDCLNPTCKKDRKALKDRPDNWPGTAEVFDLYDDAMKAAKGRKIGPLAPRVLALSEIFSDLPCRHPTDGKTHPYDLFVDDGCVALYLDAARLDGGPVPPHPYPQVRARGCPVAALVQEYDRLAAAELETSDNGTVDAVRAAGDARDELAARIANLKATSTAGAALQAAIAIEYSDLARGCEKQGDRDFYQELCERLLESVLGVIGGALPENLWFFHVGHAQRPLQHAPEAAVASPARARWEANRDAYLAAQAASDALDNGPSLSDEEVEPVHNARCTALEAFEATTPPDLQALAEMMRISLEQSGSLKWRWNGVDCPMTMRDMLDTGDAGDIYTARYFMHVLRLAGVDSPVLATPPIAGLYPSFDDYLHDEPADKEAAWRDHHAKVEPYPGRADELYRWMRDEGRLDTRKPAAPLPFDPARVNAELEAIGCNVYALGFTFPDGLTLQITQALSDLTAEEKEACMAFAARTEALDKAFPEPAKEG